MEKSFLIPISRRDLLKLAGLTAVNAVLSSNKTVEAAEETNSAPTKNFNFNGAQIPTLLRADVCVIGGGCSGTAAAVTAAKNGAKVVIVEQGIVLGGLQTQGHALYN